MKKQTITQHFLAAFDRPRTLQALRFKRHKTWIELNWQEYFHRSESVALALHAHGVKKGDRVAVLSNTRWEWAALDFAIMGLGAITVPIYQSNRAEEIELVLQDCAACALVVEDESQLRKWESIAKRCKSVQTVICIEPAPGALSWEDFLAEGAQVSQDQPELFAKKIATNKISDDATIVYTSGTTGNPRGVRLTHLQIVSEVEDLVHAFPISSADSTLTFLPYAHVLGRVELWLHAYLGFTMSFAESVDKLRANLKEVKPTVIIGVPRIFEKIFSGVMTEVQSNPWRKSFFGWLEQAPSGLWGTLLKVPRRAVLDTLLYSKLREGLGGRLRFTVSGGAPLEAGIARFFFEAGILILEGYGLTETTAAITVNTPDAFEFGTVGKPLADVQIRLAADGEVLIKSNKVMGGYYKDEEGSAQVMHDGFFATGDVGEWTPSGFLRITDRKKDLIKTAGGKYVAPQKLEGLLKMDPLISNVLIHGDRKKYVVALFTLDEGAAKKIARDKGWTFRDFRTLTQSPEVTGLLRKTVANVNTDLASYETIKNFAILPQDFTIESGELTPSLKVKRKLCDERYKDVIATLY